MTRYTLPLALAAVMAAPLWADVPPTKGKCSTAEEAGLFVAASLSIAATIVAIRVIRRGIRGRA